jgi:hypothetical protein
LADGGNAAKNCASRQLRHPALLERASLSGFFPRELIDNASGAGSTLQAADLNNDGAVDIVTGNKLGPFIFWGKPHPAADKTLEALIVCRS